MAAAERRSLLPLPRGDRPALIVPAAAGPGRTVSFAQLSGLVNGLAEALATRLAPGERALVVGLATPEQVAALIALLRLGATAAVWAGEADGSAVVRAATTVQARLILADPDLARIVGDRWPAADPPVVVDPARLADEPAKLVDPPGPARPPVAPTTAGLILFTPPAGPGGDPGAVILTDAVVAARLRALARVLDWSANDVFMPAAPLNLLQALSAGRPCLLGPEGIAGGRPAALADLPDWLAAHGVTVAEASPAVWRHLAERCLTARRTLGLRALIVAGGPATPRLVADLAQVAPGAASLIRYGSPMADPVATITGAEVLAGARSEAYRGVGLALGRPVPEVMVQLVAEDGAEVPADCPGEIRVSGPLVAQPLAGVTATAGGVEPGAAVWRTGDVATRDGSGRLWLVGRADSVIRYRAERLYPRPVEVVIETLPFIQQAALVGIPGSGPGASERSVLAAVLDPAVARGEDWMVQVFDRCVAALGTFPVDDVVVVADLPFVDGQPGRVDYQTLRHRLVDADSPTHVRAWLRERFPVLAAAGLTLWYAAAQFCLAAAAMAPGRPIRLTWHLPAAWLVVFLVAFHARVALDLRDSAGDRLSHPGRLLARGLVTQRGLRRLGLAAVALEAVVAATMGEPTLVGLAGVLLITWFVYRDLYLGSRLARHPLARDLASLLLVPATALFVFTCAAGQMPWTAPTPVLLYAWSTFLVGVAVAVAWRCRRPGGDTPDSGVTARWRPAAGTLAPLAAAAVVNGAVSHLMGLSPWYIVALTLLLVPAVTAATGAARSGSTAAVARLTAAASLFLFAFDWLLLAALVAAFGLAVGAP